MRISAYIPCYDARATIREAVKSVLEQTRRPDETFVLDDGSTDGSEILEGVRVIRLEFNQGTWRSKSKSNARG